LITVEIPDIIERQRQIRQITLRVLPGQLPANPKRLLIGLPSLLQPVLIAINTPQIVERQRDRR
jgi:hypothetical protein